LKEYHFKINKKSFLMISHAATKKSEQYNRKLVAINLADYEAQLKSGKAQRNAAEALGIPRGTLNEWKDRKDKIPYAKSALTICPSKMTSSNHA
jgi:hypothetical protein